jgi:hypothetical protein
MTSIATPVKIFAIEARIMPAVAIPTPETSLLGRDSAEPASGVALRFAIGHVLIPIASDSSICIKSAKRTWVVE